MEDRLTGLAISRRSFPALVPTFRSALSIKEIQDAMKRPDVLIELSPRGRMFAVDGGDLYVLEGDKWRKTA